MSHQSRSKLAIFIITTAISVVLGIFVPYVNADIFKTNPKSIMKAEKSGSDCIWISDEKAANKASDYIAKNLPETYDVSAVSDAILALSVIPNRNKDTIKNLANWLKKNHAKETKDETGKAAKSAFVLLAAGISADDPEVKKLLDQVASNIDDHGKISKGYLNEFTESWALMALAKGGRDIPKNLIDFILTYQKRDGGFGSPDNTGIILTALAMVKGEIKNLAKIELAFSWAKKNMDSAGFWKGYSPVNSTGMMISGLNAWKQNTDKASSWIKKTQLSSGAWPIEPGQNEANLMATYQGIIGVTKGSFADAGKTKCQVAPTPEPTPVTPTPEPTSPVDDKPSTPVKIPDSELKKCLSRELDNKTITKERLAKISTLSCSDGGITNLEGLQYLTSAKVIDLTRSYGKMNNYQDISVLKSLNSLVELRIPSAGVSDLTPVQNLSSLQKLVASGNKIINLQPISKLKNLTDLDLANNQIQDLAGLENHSKLSQLWLMNNQIKDITPLTNNLNLKYLNLFANQISDASVLGKLVNLESLSLQKNQLSNIDAFSSLKNLTGLNISENKISDISALAKLVKLETLEAVSNQIDSLTPLSNLKKLTDLKLNQNKISDIIPLKDIDNLENLNLCFNQISDISALANKANLKWLDLRDNKISDISSLQSSTQMKGLFLSNNQISDIGVLVGMKELFSIHASNNPISDINMLSKLDNLTNIVLDGALVTDASAISMEKIKKSYTNIDLSNQHIVYGGLIVGDEVKLPEIIRPSGEKLTLKAQDSEDVINNGKVTFTKAGSHIFTWQWRSENDKNFNGTLEYQVVNKNEIKRYKGISGSYINFRAWDYLPDTTLKFKVTWTNGKTEEYTPCKTGNDGTVNNCQLHIPDALPAGDAPFSVTDGKTTDKAIIEVLDSQKKFGFPDSGLTTCVANSLNQPDAKTFTASELAKVESLDCAKAKGYEIKNLNGIEHLVHLNNFNLAEQPISEISELANNTQLAKLNLAKTGVTKVTDLAKLEKLETLDLANTNFTDITQLAELKNLHTLNLTGIKVSEAEKYQPLAQLLRLRIVILDEVGLKEIGAVADLGQVEKISLRKNHLKDLQALAALPNSVVIDVSEQNITDDAKLARKYLLPKVVDEKSREIVWQNTEDSPKPAADDSVVFNNAGAYHYTWTRAYPNRNIKFSGTLSVEVKENESEKISFTDEILEKCIANNLGNSKQKEFSKAELNTISKLDCKGQIKNLSNLEYLTNLSGLNLDLDNSDLNDFAPIAGLNKLQQLKIVNSLGLANLQGLTNLKKLSDLDLEQIPGFNSLSGIEENPNLQSVTIKNAALTSIAPITNLANITKLDLSHNQKLADHEKLANLTNLVMLNISDSGAKDISWAASLNKLESFIGSQNQITDISTLASLSKKSLKKIDFTEQNIPLPDQVVDKSYNLPSVIDYTNQKIKDFTVTEGSGVLEKSGDEVSITYKKVDEVNKITFVSKASFAGAVPSTPYFSGNFMQKAIAESEIKYVNIPDANLKGAINSVLNKPKDSEITYQEAAKVVELRVNPRRSREKIKDLTGLEALVNLENLDLSLNSFTSIAPMKDLKKLKSLTLNETKVVDISPLANLNMLKTFICEQSFSPDGTKLEDISALAKLTDLETLVLSRQNISDISSLQNLKSLKELRIASNPIKDNSVIAGLTNLETLNITDTNDPNLSIVASLRKLKFLEARNIGLMDLSPLTEAPYLSDLTISYNPGIKDYSPLTTMPMLNNLDVSYNGITKIDWVDKIKNLKKFVFSSNHIPDISVLSKIDAKDLKIAGLGQKLKYGPVYPGHRITLGHIRDENNEKMNFTVERRLLYTPSYLGIEFTDENGKKPDNPNDGGNTVKFPRASNQPLTLTFPTRKHSASGWHATFGGTVDVTVVEPPKTADIVNLPKEAIENTAISNVEVSFTTQSGEPLAEGAPIWITLPGSDKRELYLVGKESKVVLPAFTLPSKIGEAKLSVYDDAKDGEALASAKVQIIADNSPKKVTFTGVPKEETEGHTLSGVKLYAVDSQNKPVAENTPIWVLLPGEIHRVKVLTDKSGVAVLPDFILPSKRGEVSIFSYSNNNADALMLGKANLIITQDATPVAIENISVPSQTIANQKNSNAKIRVLNRFRNPVPDGSNIWIQLPEKNDLVKLEILDDGIAVLPTFVLQKIGEATFTCYEKDNRDSAILGEIKIKVEKDPRPVKVEFSGLPNQDYVYSKESSGKIIAYTAYQERVEPGMNIWLEFPESVSYEKDKDSDFIRTFMALAPSRQNQRIKLVANDDGEFVIPEFTLPSIPSTVSLKVYDGSDFDAKELASFDISVVADNRPVKIVRISGPETAPIGTKVKDLRFQVLNRLDQPVAEGVDLWIAIPNQENSVKIVTDIQGMVTVPEFIMISVPNEMILSVYDSADKEANKIGMLSIKAVPDNTPAAVKNVNVPSEIQAGSKATGWQVVILNKMGNPISENTAIWVYLPDSSQPKSYYTDANGVLALPDFLIPNTLGEVTLIFANSNSAEDDGFAKITLAVKPEPVKPEPVKPEPVKPEPVKPEPVKPSVPQPLLPSSGAEIPLHLVWLVIGLLLSGVTLIGRKRMN